MIKQLIKRLKEIMHRFQSIVLLRLRKRQDGIDSAFGLMKYKKIDSVRLQRELRDEW